MENSEDNQLPTSLSSFLMKLWNMVCNPDSDDIITWSISGNSFVIKDQIIFYTKLLPMYYKHNNMTSFIRQLNLYGFHKIPNADNNVIEFYHPFFLKDEPKLLSQIKRKTPLSKCKSEPSEKSEDLQKVLSEAKLVKDKQDTVDDQVAQLRQENAALWYELNELRVKNKKQSKIVNKLVQFLVNFIQPKLKDVHNSKPQSSSGGATIFEVDGEAGASDCWKQIDEKMIEDKSGKLTDENKMIKDETKKIETPKNKERSLSVINSSNPVRILNEICNMAKGNTVYHSGESKPKLLKLASSSKTHDSKQSSISNSADSLLEILERSLQDSVENDDRSIIYPDPNLDTGNTCPAIDYKKPNQRKKLQEACGSKLPRITSYVKKDVATVIDDRVSRDIQNDIKSKRIKKLSQSSSKNPGKVTVGSIATTPAVLDIAADILSSNKAVDITANQDCQEPQTVLTEELKTINMPVNSDVSLSDDIGTLFAASQNNPIILELPENYELQNYLPQKEKVPITAQQLGLHVESTENDLNNLKDFLRTYEIDPDAVLEMLANESNSRQTLSDSASIKMEPSSSKLYMDSETDLLTCTADEVGADNLDYIPSSSKQIMGCETDLLTCTADEVGAGNLVYIPSSSKQNMGSETDLLTCTADEVSADNLVYIPSSSKQIMGSETDLLTCTADEAGAGNLDYIPSSSKQNMDSETDLLTCTVDEVGADNLDYIDASLLFDDNCEPQQSAGTSNLSKKSLISRKKNLH